MNEKVQNFLNKQQSELERQDKLYHDLVMEYADLVSPDAQFVEITQEEYRNLSSYINAKIEYDKYYVKKRIPIEITNEEFAAVEAAIPNDILADLKLKASGQLVDKEAEKSGAALFFTVIACIFFIGGFILALVTSISSSNYHSDINLLTFITGFLTYFLYGAFALCAAELFKKLQTIVNLLRKKQ